MNFDPLSFAIGKHGDSGPVRDVVSYLIGRVAGTAGEIWQTLTNVAVVSFTSVSSTLRELIIGITPVQSTGTPTPETPLPISGWTGATVTVVGKNLMDMTAVVAGAVDIDGSVVASTSTKVSALIRVFPETAYIASGFGNTSCRPHFYRTDGTYIGYGSAGVNIITPASCGWMRLQGANSFWNGATTPQLEIGTTVSVYAPYSGTVYSVSWQTEAGTVYGGSLTDNGNGMWTLTVTMEMSVFGDKAWIKRSGDNCFITQSYRSVIKKPAITLCSMLKEAESPNYNDDYAIAANGDIYCFPSTEYSSSAEFKAAFASAQFVYELSTPQTYTLTAESVQALLGQNNIFADTGNINTITFRTH